MDLLSMYKEQCEASIGAFKEKVFGEKTLWVSRGILMSEGFAVCVAMDLYNIDMLLESGICNGHSTQIWANYNESISIKAFDHKLKLSTKNRLSHLKNISMESGNSMVMIPEAVRNNKDKKIGVFIDGPKGLKALELVEECYKYNNVVFVGAHDFGIVHGLRADYNKMINRLEAKSFFSDEEWFVNAYRDLDSNETHKHDNGQSWMPYNRISRNGVVSDIGSYGPTVGIIFKEV